MCKTSFDEYDEAFGLINDISQSDSPKRSRTKLCACLLFVVLFSLVAVVFPPVARSVEVGALQRRSTNVIPHVAILLQSSPESFGVRVKHIRETWGARVKMKSSLGLYFVVGNVTDGGNDMLKSDCEQGYFSGICRLGFAIQFVYEKGLTDPEWMKYEWYLLADDDVYILPDNLQRMIIALGDTAGFENKAYCLPGCVTDFCVGYCGGGGILLSRYVIERIVKERDSTKYPSLIAELQANDDLCTQYHDVSFGFFLEHNRTNIFMAPYSYDPYAFGFKDSFEMWASLKSKQSLPWLYHYPSRGAMHWLDNMIKDLGVNKEIHDELS